MSSDNGIYILQTKDQFRVIHAQGIDNLFWSFVDFKTGYEIVPTRVIEFFGGCKFTRNSEVANQIASNMAKRVYVLEYGVSTIKIDKTWKQIVEEAKEYAKLEIAAIETNNDGRWNYTLEDLRRLVSENNLRSDAVDKKQELFDAGWSFSLKGYTNETGW